MIKYLKLHDDKCVGCMTCTATCSRLYAKLDNPAKSRLQVNPLGAGKFHLIACDQECRKCVAECPTQAISVNSQGVVLINKSLCVGCLACVAVCPIDAMRFFPGESTPYKCVACGACVKTCPKDALEIGSKEDGPASQQYQEFAAVAQGART